MSNRNWTVGILATGAITKMRVEKESFLDAAEELLGGMFERVRLSENLSMIVDESGLIKGLPDNKIASRLYGTHIHGAPIVGDAFMCSEDYVEEDGFWELDLVWLTEEQADELILFFPEFLERRMAVWSGR